MPHSFAQDIFHKPIDQINQDDLLTYFNQERDETLLLEFKSFTDKPEDKRSQPAKEAERIRGVLKTIGAFLNSSGGLLIWGAPQPVEVMRGEKNVKVCSGPLAPVPKYYDRDDFINKLAGQIDSLPYGVRMQPVTVDGGYVYLFDVPESNNKPHQYDGRYYVRMDTRTDVAPHYLVYALCHQIKAPILELEVKAEGHVTVSSDFTRPPVAKVKLIVRNKTPFVHDTDIYIVCRSEEHLRFGTTPNAYDAVSTIRLSPIETLLPFGLPAMKTINIFLPDHFSRLVHDFDIWYGGGRSTVTQAFYSLTARQISSPEDSNKTFAINIELCGESGLDRRP